ncbi:unnamed protein product [Aureobasidium vineae]|uniref:Uncharacterized protein n=1 Tax=Aureobasidium vineae TaxID=2773715 RepID=A0A9N8P5L7_9PEZI|nr:unnamed protein product [Aureobasidium vineae]
MADHVAVDSRLPSSPFGSACSGPAPLYAPDSLTVWHSSPSKPSSTSQNDCGFDVEELSENDVDYPNHARVLHPYELEEVDTPAADCGHVDLSHEIDIEDGEENTQDSDSAALARRLCRMRWKPASRPYAFTRSLPIQANHRKRSRSEALDTDTDSDGFDSLYTRPEPPKMRRRTQRPDNISTIATPLNMSDASTPQATTTASMFDDLMDVDAQAT